MKIHFEYTGRALSEKTLKKLEKKLETELPADYKAFLTETNGGVPEDDLSFSFRENGKPSETVLGQFYTLGKETDDLDSIAEGLEIFIEGNRMPGWFLPVACDAFGNQVCLSLAKAEFGKVYFWNHEEEPDEEDDPIEFKNIYFVADTFGEFLSKLEIVTDD